MADGALWNGRDAASPSCRSPVSYPTNQGTIRGVGRTLFPQPGRTVECGVRNSDGSASTCRWLADSSRRSAVPYKCSMRVSRNFREEGEHFITGPEFGGIGEL